MPSALVVARRLPSGLKATLRSFYVCSKQTGTTLKLPSDLVGISALEFEWNGRKGSLPDALKPICTKLLEVVRERSGEPGFTMLPSTALAIGYFKNFILDVCRELMNCESLPIDGQTVNVRGGDFDGATHCCASAAAEAQQWVARSESATASYRRVPIHSSTDAPQGICVPGSGRC